MFYRLIYILMFNVFFCQSFFNSSIGNEIGFQSARSLAIGQTHFMNSNTSAMALRNPGMLGRLDIPYFNPNKRENKLSKRLNNNTKFISFGLKIDYNFLGSMQSERRAMDLKDFFGGYFTEGDYVINNNFNSYQHIGVMGNVKLSALNLGFALSSGPWSSLDYSYNEEVRGMVGSSEIVRDPLIGYHIFENEGTIDLTSAGIGLALNQLISLGGSFNYIHDGSYNYNLDVIQIDNSSQHLASVVDVNQKRSFKNTSFQSFSFIFSPKNYQISLGFEEKAEILNVVNNSAYIIGSASSGLPIYITPFTIDAENNITFFDPSELVDFVYEDFELLYLNNFYIEKPQKMKFGINYKRGANKYSRLVSLEIVKNIFSKKNILFQDFYQFNIGIEYVNYDKVFRAGLSYKESPFLTAHISPLTTFSFGTSKKIDKLIFDLGLSYSYQKYKYHDLFPVSNDSRPNFDNVHESNWTLLSTISYQF